MLLINLKLLLEHKNAILIGLLSGSMFSGLSLFYDFVIDDSMQRHILYYIVFFVIYFLFGYTTASVSLKNKDKK